MEIKVLRQILIMSRYALLGIGLQCVLCSMLMATEGKAQPEATKKMPLEEIYVSVDLNNKTLKDAFSILTEKTEFNFIYDRAIIKDSRNIQVAVKNQSLDDLLRQIARAGKVQFKRVNGDIFVKNKTFLQSDVQETIGKTISFDEERQVSGRVTDEKGEPIPGANVFVKNTTIGTVTDANGEFSLEIPDDASILVFSFVGMTEEEVEIGNQSFFEISLFPDIQSLQEIVVIGYGAAVDKKDITGSIASADLDRAMETPNISVIEALQGSIAGLNVGAVDVAGGNPSLSIRGQSTLSSEGVDNAPLIILDGIIYRGSIIDLNPADIESVDILKDASSAAIYGSQASNGVIVITTKNGTAQGKPVINYTASYSIQTPSNSKRPMRAAEYEEFYPDIFWEEGARLAPDFLQDNPDYDFRQNLKTNFLTDGFNNGVDTDWWDLLTQNGYVNSHNLSIRGKNENMNYFVSGGITDQQGFLVNDEYTRYNFRVNLDAKINNWLNVGTQTYVTVSDYSGQNASSRDIFRVQPWAPIRDEEGEIITNPVDGLSPILFAEQDNSDIRLNLQSNMYAEIQLPLEGLSYRLNYANGYRTRNENVFNPWGSDFTGAGHKRNQLWWDWTLDNIVSYNRTFQDVHNLGVTLVYGVEKRHISSTLSQARNFGVDILGFDRLQAGDPTLNTITTEREEESSLYQMVRVLYDYKNRYYFTGTVRRDGFSGFGTNDKTSTFPSAAVAWVISEESFASDLSWLSFLKLRASYGQLGRRGVGRYATLAEVEQEPSVVFGDGSAPSQGQAIISLANPELGWETTTGSNFGLDFEVFNSRLRGSIEYYQNKTENILFAIALPRITGFDDISSNIAEVSNNGIELSLSTTVIDKGPWRWDASFNFNRVRNEVNSILGVDNDNDGREDDLIASGLFIGEPQNTIFNYEIIGMWQLADEVEGGIWQGFLPGTYKLNDLNGDGAISSLDDRKVIGYEDPSFRFGINNTVNYKNFSLNIFVNSIQGGENFYLGDDGLHSVREQLSFTNVPSGGFDYWMPENPNARYRRLDTPSQFGAQPSNPNGAKPYSQRNFVRLQNVSLSYTIPNEFIEKFNISSARVFLGGKNLVTWTNWAGWDPETGSGFGANANGLPVMRSYSLGLNVEF